MVIAVVLLKGCLTYQINPTGNIHVNFIKTFFNETEI